MPLAAGSRLGVYEIVALLGAGGMGEVYRGTDTDLKRDVAIKVLPDSLAGDADRLARFRREAEVLAALNHPNIAHIHGLEKFDGTIALVMELVEGPTLADLIAEGPIPSSEALPLATQIAEALEAAHDQGIIHRDLKPANIKVRPDGTVKVLDFGLAKVLAPAVASLQVTQSPTITTPAMTQIGMVLGTAAYLSPEQAKGFPADKRSDVWAFGCVLYEMLSGQRAFAGDNVADTLAMVLKGEADLAALPAVPPPIRELIRGCLRKDRKQRIGDISTARFLFNHLLTAPHSEDIAGSTRPVWRRVTLVLGSMLAAVATTVAVISRGEPADVSQIIRFTITLPPEQQLTLTRRALAISPDGTRLVYAAEGALFLRSLSEFDGRAIPGAETGITPAFSPDGQSLAFYGDSAIKRIGIGGGTAVTVCRIARAPGSLAWDRDGIVFSETGSAIQRVSANGGQPAILADLSKSDDLAYSPQLLPDNDTLLFSVVKRGDAAIGRWEATQVVIQSIKTGVRKTLIEAGSEPQYVPTGHIVYGSQGTLFAVPFDLKTLAVTGGTVPIVEGVRRGATFGLGGTAQFAFSSSGSLVFVPGPQSVESQDLMLFDRRRGAEALKLPPGLFEFPRVSPDGTRIAFGNFDGKEAAVWIYNLSGASGPRRLTFGGNNRYPIWSRDGEHVAFQSDREGDLALFWQPAAGGTATRLTRPDAGTSHVPDTWSPDRDVLLFSATRDSVSSLWTLSIKERTVAPFSDVKDLSLPPDAMFSPDGRWVAYQVGEPRAVEGTTFVQPFPPTGARHQVARGGRPLWSRDGKEIFLVPAPGRLTVVAVQADPILTFGNPVAVPRGFGEANPTRPRTFDIMPDGRIVGVGTAGQVGGPGASELRVVVNWFEELKARVPANQ